MSAWHENIDEVLEFGHVLVDAGWLSQDHDELDYVEKPWKWDPEHETWELQGRPTVISSGWDFFIRKLDAESRIDNARDRART